MIEPHILTGAKPHTGTRCCVCGKELTAPATRIMRYSYEPPHAEARWYCTEDEMNQDPVQEEKADEVEV